MPAGPHEEKKMIAATTSLLPETLNRPEVFTLAVVGGAGVFETLIS